MVSNKLKYIVLLFLAIISPIVAQPNTFVRTSVNAKIVKVKQPFELKISVYTPTWFTSAPNLDNIVIPGALTIKKDRAQSTFEVIENVRYTILYFQFFVFPLKHGELVIPELFLSYATPEQGDFIGKDVERKTKPLALKVDSLDKGRSLNNWLVATSYNVSQSWNKDLTKLKVGDVVERTITTNATGTLAALIPSSDTLSVDWGKAYYKTPTLKTEIVEGNIRSRRTEFITILIEKPGEYVVPEQSFSWWNPGNKRLYSKSLSERKIIIEDNPDLAILKSIQDSLDTINQAGQKEIVEDKPFTIFGLLLWQFIIALALAIVIILQIRRIIIYLINKLKVQKAAYLQSEKFYFKQLIVACDQNNLMIIRNRLFEWVSNINKENKIQSVHDFLSKYGSAEMMDIYNSFEKQLFGKDQSEVKFSANKFVELLIITRKKYLNKSGVSDDVTDFKFHLNPYNFNSA
jgi:hypothetical protein